MTLPHLTAISDTYAVGEVLREPEPFVATYRGWDVETEEQVKIKEYFPVHLAEREDEVEVVAVAGSEELFQYGHEQFLEEASVLETLDHPNVVPELAPVEAHGTIYRVLEHEPGASLEDGLARKGGKLPERAALAILMPILEGIQAAHKKGIIHGVVSPQSIFLAKRGRPLLRDFGGAQMQLARRTEQLDAVLATGYAAPEQYVADSKIGPWMDVYGWGAVLYRVLTGEAPLDAKVRLQDDTVPTQIDELDEVSAGLKQTLKRVLALNPSERPSTVKALQELLEHPSEVSEAPAAQEGDPEEETDPAAEEAAAPTREETPSPPSSEAPVEEPESVEETEETSADEKKIAAEKTEEAEVEGRGENDSPEEADEIEQPMVEERPPAYETAARSVEHERSRTPIYAAAAVLLLLLAGGAPFLFMGDDSAQAQLTPAAEFKRQGDSLFERGQYEAARARYKQALTEEPADDYATRRIEEAKKKIEEQNERQYYERVRQGDTLMARAQRRFTSGDSVKARALLEKASTEFTRALNNKPNDSLALAKIQTVTDRLFQREGTQEDGSSSEEQEEDFQERMFTYLRNQGDRLLQQESYEAAKRKYEQALEIQEDGYTQERIDEIEDLLAEREREQRYARYMEEGKQYLAADSFEAAATAFEQALEMSPGDSTAQQWLAEAERRLKEVQAQHRYQELIAQGDERMEAGEPEVALEHYKQALTHKANDSYAQRQIEEAQQRIQEQKRREEYEKERVDENGIYKLTDTPPELVGSMADLYSELRYPRRAYDEQVEGQVFVRFVVDEEGNVSNPEIVRGIGYGTGEEVKRAIKEMKFTPGKVKGEPVKAWQTLMVRFQTDDFE